MPADRPPHPTFAALARQRGRRRDRQVRRRLARHHRPLADAELVWIPTPGGDRIRATLDTAAVQLTAGARVRWWLGRAQLTDVELRGRPQPPAGR